MKRSQPYSSMAPKKENGRGSKFQKRLPTETRPRVVRKTENRSENTAAPRKTRKSTDGEDSYFSRSKTPYSRGNDRLDSGRRNSYTSRNSSGGDDSNSRGRNPRFGGRGDAPATGRRTSFNSRNSGGADENAPRGRNPRFNSRGDAPSTGRRTSYNSRNTAGGDDNATRGRNTRYGSRGDAPGTGRRNSSYPRTDREENTDRPNKRFVSRDNTADSPRSRKPGTYTRSNDFGSKPPRSRSYGDKPRGFSNRNESSGDDRNKTFRKSSPQTGDDANKRINRSPASEARRETRKLDRKMVKNTRKNSQANYKGSAKKLNKAGDNLSRGKELVETEVRLNRYIANSGLCSRREADALITQGLVHINGVVVTEMGTKVNPGDVVKVDGQKITPEKAVYILLNKPKGYITSTMDPEGRPTVMDLLDLPGKERIYPIGRLDRNTTGVLLLTNDGDLAQKLMHPSFEIKKVYKAKLDHKPSRDHMLAWVNGVELEDGFMSFEQCGFVDPEDDTLLGVEIHSGRNRIVRRMFEHFGYEVLGLDRVLLGDFDHVKLGRGKWRFLSEKEEEYVMRLKRMKPKNKN
ncbi:MAG: RNA-binding S4 domain-containing protein [Bacteroidetes bacterium]|nr:RNA-binding S4 domain-containing protein [Bacteroidota bacterium]